MLTLLVGFYGVWIGVCILPFLLVVRLLHQPVDLPVRERFAFPIPQLRRRGIRVRNLMVLVLLVSVDCSIIMATFPRQTAIILVVADMVVILVTVLIATFVLLTPMQNAALTVLLAFVALRIVWPMLVP